MIIKCHLVDKKIQYNSPGLADYPQPYMARYKLFKEDILLNHFVKASVLRIKDIIAINYFEIIVSVAWVPVA